MATKAEVDQRAMIFLGAVDLMLADLPEVAAQWDSLSDAERVSWSLDWDHTMADQLGELAAMYGRGSLSEEHAVAYRQLLQQLKRALPTIRRLNLYRPPVPLDG